MFQRRSFAVLPAVLLAALSATPALAAEDVLDVIPDGSLGFVVVNRLAETDAKAVQLGARMQLPVPSLMALLKMSTGVQQGLDEKGSAAVVLMPAENDNAKPIQILMVPVTDFGQLIGQLKPKDTDAKPVEVEILGKPFLVGSRHGYAVFAKPKHGNVLKSVLESDSPAGGLDDVAPMRNWLSENDVAAVLTRRGVKLLVAKAQQGLRHVKAEMAKVPEEMKQDMEAAISVFGVYEDILQTVGGEKETEIYAAGVRVDEQGALWVTDWTRFDADGHLAKILADVKPQEQDLLAGLPARPFVAVGAGALPESMAKALTQFSIDFMKSVPELYGLDEEQVEKLGEISAQSMTGIRAMSMMLGVGKPSDPIYSDLAFTMTVDDAPAYMAKYKKSIEAMNELVEGAEDSILQGTKLTEVKIGGKPGLKISMKFPTTPQVKNIPNYEQMMEKMFGRGGRITIFMAAADEHTIVAAYTKRAMLVRSLRVARGIEPGLAAEKNVAVTVAMLPPGAQWVGYWNPKGTIDYFNRIIPVFAPKPEADFRLPDFPATPPIGFAAKTDSDGLRGYMVVPAPVLKAIGEFVVEAKKLRQQ